MQFNVCIAMRHEPFAANWDWTFAWALELRKANVKKILKKGLKNA